MASFTRKRNLPHMNSINGVIAEFKEFCKRNKLKLQIARLKGSRGLTVHNYAGIEVMDGFIVNEIEYMVFLYAVMYLITFFPPIIKKYQSDIYVCIAPTSNDDVQKGVLKYEVAFLHNDVIIMKINNTLMTQMIKREIIIPKDQQNLTKYLGSLIFKDKANEIL